MENARCPIRMRSLLVWFCASTCIDTYGLVHRKSSYYGCRVARQIERYRNSHYTLHDHIFHVIYVSIFTKKKLWELQAFKKQMSIPLPQTLSKSWSYFRLAGTAMGLGNPTVMDSLIQVTKCQKVCRWLDFCRWTVQPLSICKVDMVSQQGGILFCRYIEVSTLRKQKKVLNN